MKGDILDINNISIWKAVGIYGWADGAQKCLTWQLMRNMKSSSSLPLLTFGDFNEILGMNEKEGGAIQGERQMDAFRLFGMLYMIVSVVTLARKTIFLHGKGYVNGYIA